MDLDERLRLLETELAVVKDAVENHLPSLITDLKQQVSSLDRKMWGILILMTGALLGLWLR